MFMGIWFDSDKIKKKVAQTKKRQTLSSLAQFASAICFSEQAIRANITAI